MSDDESSDFSMCSDNSEHVKTCFEWKEDPIDYEFLTNDMPLIEIIENTNYGSWKSWFDKNFDQISYVASKIDQLYKEEVVCPDKRDIFAFLEYTEFPLGVFLGMDPFHTVENGKPIAHGLSFSVLSDKLPPSLRNIFQEIKNEYPDYIPPKNGCLTMWAKQGIMLMNSCLTVREGCAGSHIKKRIWDAVVQPLIQEIITRNPKCIFVLWGRDAQKAFELYNKKDGIITLESAHPSGLSAHRGFFGNGHFKKVNEYLVQQGRDEIIW